MEFNSPFKYEIVDDFDRVIDEEGTQFIALRKIRWNDRDKVSLDIRKYYMDKDGEKMGKGVSFITEEGPHNLVNTMVQEGYGDTRDILNSLKNRDDFNKSLNSILDKDSKYYDNDISENEPEEYYDPKSLLD